MINNFQVVFNFENHFIEDNVRCIPMLVRFKLDAVGIKLKLSEWSKFSSAERSQLMVQPCATVEQMELYRIYLQHLVTMHTGGYAALIAIEENPGWAKEDQVPPTLQIKAAEFNWNISQTKWKELTRLQRFALLKLQRPGHENRNFPIAMREFGLAEF
ncbi:MAG: nitrate reductase associated protein [Bacteroidota bacterium]